MQERKMWHKIAGVENAGKENATRPLMTADSTGYIASSASVSYRMLNFSTNLNSS